MVRIRDEDICEGENTPLLASPWPEQGSSSSFENNHAGFTQGETAVLSSVFLHHGGNWTKLAWRLKQGTRDSRGMAWQINMSFKWRLLICCSRGSLVSEKFTQQSWHSV